MVSEQNNFDAFPAEVKCGLLYAYLIKIQIYTNKRRVQMTSTSIGFSPSNQKF